MDKHCNLCDQPCKPRHDRPGKFFTLCAEHYAEYQRQKNRESYARHAEKRRTKRREYYWKDPEKSRQVVRDWIAKPENHQRKLEYMRFYNAPYRVHLKDACEQCGFEAVDPRQLDIHHVDGDHSNNDPSNLQTLCPPCHRLIPVD